MEPGGLVTTLFELGMKKPTDLVGFFTCTSRLYYESIYNR